jgi:flagellar assembly factor FliW
VKVASKAYGLIEVDERQKITFPQGLFGFESFQEYVLLDAKTQPYYYLQSVDVEGVAFILINPFLFRPDYELNINNDELKDIEISAPENALIFSIVTIPQEGPMTANLQGPLIINRDTRCGKQAILTDPRWKTKHDVMAEFSVVKQSGTAGRS